MTDALKRRIEALEATGVLFGQVEVSKSEEFKNLYPSCDIPTFDWLQAIGKPGEDDFTLSDGVSLMISERALGILKEAGMKHAEVFEFISQDKRGQ